MRAYSDEETRIRNILITPPYAHERNPLPDFWNQNSNADERVNAGNRN